jgi:TonB family protein
LQEREWVYNLSVISLKSATPRDDIPDSVGLEGSLMFMSIGRSRFATAASQAHATAVLCAIFALSLAAAAQQPQPDAPQQPAPTTTTPAPTPDAAHAPAPATDVPQSPAPAPTAAPSTPGTKSSTASSSPQPGSITEEELKQMLVGKQLYLRGGYLGDSLTFDEHGHMVGHPPQGSYTLSVIQIDHVRLTKHKVEIEGARYGLHFNEQLAYEDSSNAYDKVRITPKKKIVKITIDREMVVNPKKKKESSKEKGKAVKPAVAALPATAATAPTTAPAPSTAVAAQASALETPDVTASSAAPSGTPDQPSAQTQQVSSAPAATSASQPAASASDPAEMSEADQLKASIAATPEAERPADPNSVTTTTSQAHANHLLRDALDAAFAPGLDERMMAAMPEFWKLYYQAVAAKADYRPTDQSILRQNTVDQKAQILTSFEPDSNDFAQAAGVAGMALYHTVIGPDGKPSEIAVARPIGFGLDENAVAAIRKAKFSPAIKDGKPVPVMLDLVIQFRIFSKRTATQPEPETAEKDKPAEPVLPGPYTVARH